jgi:hypothetical protein
MAAVVQNIREKYDNNIDGFKGHLSNHYYFYKALSASLMVAGTLLSFKIVGHAWPEMDEKVIEPFFESAIGEKITLIYEKIFCFSCSIVENIGNLAEKIFSIKTSSYVIKGLSYLTSAGLFTTAAALFLIINAPTIISYGSFIIGVYALPILPGAIIAFAGKTLWNLTEKPANN